MDHFLRGHFTRLQQVVLAGYIKIEANKIRTAQFFSEDFHTFSTIKIGAGQAIFPVLINDFGVAGRNF